MVNAIGEIMYVTDKKWHTLYNIAFILVAAFLEVVAIIGLNILYKFFGVKFHQIILIDVLNIMVSRILMIFGYRIVLYFFKKTAFSDLEKRQGILYFILPVFSIIYTYTLLVLLEGNNGYNENILVLLSIFGLIILNIFVMEVLEYISKSNKMKNKLKLFEQQSAMQYRYYENIENKYIQSRKILHDMKNHIQAIESLYKTSGDNEAKKYTSEIFHMIDELGYKKYISNKILNLILNDKIQLANQLGIEFKTDIDDVNLNFITDFDMTTIFGNLLDNAIEACKDLENNKIVRVRINQFHNFIIINIANTLNKHPNLHNGKLETTKNGHSGIGLSNVRKTVERYNGDLNIYFEGNRFEVNINMSDK
jgi:sensor histidine kinase YesM